MQPLARKHLGAPVVRIETMSSYSCRNAYGRAGSRLSEHGRANALDIGAFVTARGQAAMVVADWGPTARDIAAQAAAAKAQPDRRQAESRPVAQPPTATQGRAAGSATAAGRAGGAPGSARASPSAFPASRSTCPAASEPSDHSACAAQPPGRPQAGEPAGAAAACAAADGKMDFLRGAHRAACKIFGTVLGPEANNAHKNHFHVDMAERSKDTMICE